MRHPDETADSIGVLVELLKKHISSFDGPIWFRGQSKVEWELIPKLLRTGAVASEAYLINKFKQNASFLLSKHPNNEFEWLYLMQHYAMPTRLLDWSESPLVALYFSVIENEDYDGALWILYPTIFNKKSNYRPEYAHEVPLFEDIHMQNYKPETIARETRSKLYPMAAIAPRNNSRMQAQQGVFTIHHREDIPIEEVGAPGEERDHIWRYIIPAKAKKNLLLELKILGFSRFQLFPELESMAFI